MLSQYKEYSEAFAREPLGMKGLNMFSKLLGVVYIDSLTTKLFEIVYYKRKLSENQLIYQSQHHLK